MHPEWALYLQVLLALHVLSGFVGFVCAPVALATVKGGKLHRRFGKIYFWAMASVAVTALILSFALPIYFLAMVAVFSFYAALAAYRILFLKSLSKGARPKTIDWLTATLTVLSSLLLFLMGFLRPELMFAGLIHIAGHTVSIVSVILGIIGIRLGLGSIYRFSNPPRETMFWWFDHMQGMIASYIAAMTAFSAVKSVALVWPSVVGLAVADDARRTGDCHLDGLLQEEIPAQTESHISLTHECFDALLNCSYPLKIGSRGACRPNQKSARISCATPKPSSASWPLWVILASAPSSKSVPAKQPSPRTWLRAHSASSP